jgi:hypothetical protein
MVGSLSHYSSFTPLSLFIKKKKKKTNKTDLLDTPDLVQVVGRPRSINPKDEAIRQEIVEEMLGIDHPMMMSLMVFYQEYWMARLNAAPSPSTFEEYIQQRLVHSGFK